MSVPKLYTYYEKVPCTHEGRDLLDLWLKHHRNMGFDAVILDPKDIPLTSWAEHYVEATKHLPSANLPKFDAVCFRRWAAMAVSGGVLMDWDVFIFHKAIEHHLTPRHGCLTIMHVEPDGPNPGMVCGYGETYRWMMGNFENWVPDESDTLNGKPHVSDMTIIRRMPVSAFHLCPLVKSYGDPGWEEAYAVHFLKKRTDVLTGERRIETIRKLCLL